MEWYPRKSTLLSILIIQYYTIINQPHHEYYNNIIQFYINF